MFSVGEDFEVIIDDVNEYFNCIANLTIKGKEYIIAENEEGTKRAFLCDSNDDEIIVLAEDEEEDILNIWEEDYYGADKDYMFWNEEFEEYDKPTKEDLEYDESEPDDIHEVDDLDESEEDLEDFIENLLD